MRKIINKCIYLLYVLLILPAADISVVVCDASKLSILLEKADQCPKLKHVVKIGDVSEEDVQNAGKFGITIKSFKEVEVMLAMFPFSPISTLL